MTAAALTDTASALLRLHAAPEARALRRLVYAEVTQFPDRLARLMLDGRLRTADLDVLADAAVDTFLRAFRSA